MKVSFPYFLALMTSTFLSSSVVESFSFSALSVVEGLKNHLGARYQRVDWATSAAAVLGTTTMALSMSSSSKVPQALLAMAAFSGENVAVVAADETERFAKKGKKAKKTKSSSSGGGSGGSSGSSGGVAAAIPFTLGCVLGVSVRIGGSGGGCALGGPFDLSNVLPCEQSSGTDPCYEEGVPGGDGTLYTKTIKETQQMSTLMSSVSTAEGSYSGFSSSASASYLSTGTSSSVSYKYTIGQAQVLFINQIKNYVHLKLREDAMNLLTTNPEAFLNQYSDHFVSSIGHGVYFIGSTELYQSETSSTESLDTFASFSADEVFFSASASEQFSSAVNQSGSYLQVVTTARYTGSEGIVPYDSTDTYGLGQFYESYWAGVTAEMAAPMTLDYLNWRALDEINDYLSTTGNDTLIDMFTPVGITSDTSEKLNNELVQSQNLENTVLSTKQWPCYKRNRTSSFAYSIDSILDDVEQHVQKLEQLTEHDILAIQTDLTDGDSSFFTFEDLNWEYQEVLDANPDCLPICPGDLWSPSTKTSACGDGTSNPSVYQCARNSLGFGGLAPMDAIRFNHNCGDNHVQDERVSVSCMDTSVLAKENAPVSVGDVYTTEFKRNSGCGQSYTGHDCPTGYYVRQVRFAHKCDDNLSYERSVSLQCVKPNKDNGYELKGIPHTYDWVKKDNCKSGNYATATCGAGEVMVGIDFAHGCNDNKIHQESVRVRCQPLTGKELFCGADTLEAGLKPLGRGRIHPKQRKCKAD